MKYHAARLVGALALVLLAALSLNTVSAPPAHAEATLIQKVVVQGNQRIEAATILSYLAVQPGEKATTAQVDESLKVPVRDRPLRRRDHRAGWQHADC